MFEQWPNPESWSADPFINYLLFTFLIFIPVMRIVKRLGLPFWVCLPVFVPYIGFVITTALIAHMPWQYIDKNEKQKRSKA